MRVFAISIDRSYVVRYYLMATLGVVVNLGTFWILYHVLNIWYFFAAAAAFFFRFVFKFVVMRTRLFLRTLTSPFGRDVSVFALLEVISLAFGLTLLTVLVEILGTPPFLGLICVTTIMSLINMMATHILFSPR